MDDEVAIGPKATAAGADESIFSPRYRALSIGMVALLALYAFEALAVAAAMPTIAQALDGLSLYALAFAAVMASSVVGLVGAGRSADLHGPAVPLRQGIVMFAIGLIVAGFAPTMWVLLIGRMVQGYGGGLMAVALYVVVGRMYPPVMRARIFAAFAGAWVVPAMIGPAISGLIVEHLGWRWVFLCLPLIAGIAAVMVLPALRGIGPSPAEKRTAHTDPRRMLWAGGAALSVLLLHYAGQLRGVIVLPLLASGLVVLVFCAMRLLPNGTVRAARGLPAVMALRGIASGAFFGTEVFVPLLLSRERGLSPTFAGLALTIGALGWSTGSWYRGRLHDPDPARVIRNGLALIAIGVVGVCFVLEPAIPVPVAMIGWAVAGLGMGVVFPTLSVLTLEMSTRAEQGINSSALQLSEALVTATVLALGGSLFAALLGSAPTAAYLSGFSISIVLALGGAALAGRVRM